VTRESAGPRLDGGARSTDVPRGSRADGPLISVVTATFNDAADLMLTVESMRGLAYLNVEWIVVDGGSSDGTVDFIRQNEDVIGYWLSEPDKGIYDAWNKGVSRARGEWIAFLGAGDRYHSDALDRYVEAIRARGRTPQLVSSRVRHVNRNGEVLRVWGGPFDREKLRRYMPIGHSGALHHRSLFERYGLFDTSYSSSSDYEFLMRCREQLDALFVDAVTADMLVGGVSNTYSGLFETYRIQKKYGEGATALLQLGVACAKRLVRPWLRGY
jgi:glycosyltransferase involved in cell wall biosynthesis